MSANLEEYKFPDEASKEEAKPETEVAIEVVDDTPPEDRGRVPLPKEVLDKAVDDPLDEYSDKVQARIKQLRKGVHDERREKERAAREREEALTFAQQVHQENQLLKQRIGQNQKAYVNEATRSAETEVSMAMEKMEQAYESGDAKRIAKAQSDLTDAKLKLREYQSFRPALQDNETSVQQQQQARPVQRPQVDPKAETWRQRNTWFGTDEEMTSLALGLHEKLVRSGVDPRSDAYYQQVDATMKKRFPDYFGEIAPSEPEPEKPVRKTSTVVAPATRSTAPKQVRITASQAAIAKKLGITPEAYVREVLKLENNNV